MDASAPLLDVQDLSAAYGLVEALRPTSFSVFHRDFVAILGPNGAGKSTLLKAIMRLVRSRGNVVFDGVAISDRRTDELTGLGVAYVPEGRGILAPMTVRENLDLGGYRRRGRESAAEIRRTLETVFETFPRMKERQRQVAGSLSGGEQQLLALGRAMMSNPKLLILDEPSLGLAPRAAEEVFHALARLNGHGLTILVVEQKAPLALKLANKAHVFRGGRLASSIDPRSAPSQDELARYYLGIED
jgi:branched-chain amino acid transport system ATP-binding protein